VVRDRLGFNSFNLEFIPLKLLKFFVRIVGTVYITNARQIEAPEGAELSLTDILSSKNVKLVSVQELRMVSTSVRL
jgi:hypothetical protein